MTDRENPNDDGRLESYLDGSMSESDRHDFDEVLRRDDEQAAEVRLQSKINASLTRLFATAPPTEAHVQAVVADAVGSADRIERIIFRRRLSWVAGLAAAASIAGIFAVLNLDNGQRKTPYFQPVPVARLYREAVSNGFEPYYECRDDARFTAVFARRQGVGLHLNPMPEGSRMLGLSYPGGLSRNTTAMLCEVDGQPVMIFVDREELDLQSALQLDGDLPDVHVFRVTRNGLVFYEVSPFSIARAVEFLVLASPASDTDQGPAVAR